ncbi:nonsense-mediated mRNA decay protein 3 [Methanomicrobium sp. W14]|uniref:60S ribosomal export protein NMD3 n=1 Tax=Methanomicrobium sp. W14 TaxID=2817839 RepID=UPI001AE9E9EC|nr:60S ribosomal export protein NMD3 [Methanomicrobium sp. W14]MBP2132240.1 nonsense-mediated mRNA decay protein 3 [Methanomicrobium sp. W14]
MDIKQNICPKCGGPSEGGLCSSCRAAELEWITCDDRVLCTHCPTCGSLKQQNTWTDCKLEKDKLIDEVALSAVHIHEDVRSLSVSLETRDISPNRTSVNVGVKAKLYGVPVEHKCRVLIVWSKEQCDRCSRLSGGYYEGTIQLRADGRKPDDYEKDRANAIAHSAEDGLQETGERLSFITETRETKDGLDIIISSHNIGDIISRNIVKELGGKVTRHPKLVGEKKGIPVYRITYLVRLPKYQKGDVFEENGSYYEIRGTDSGGVKYFDLQDSSTKTTRNEPCGRLIGNVKDSEFAFVNYTEGNTAGILDPKTFENKECLTYPWLEIKEGSTIRFLRDYDNERIIFVG